MQIAKIGRTVGLNGRLKLHLQSDFPEQFVPGAVFRTNRDLSLTLRHFDAAKEEALFEGYGSKEEAAKLTNQILLSSEEETRQRVTLREGEFFWFDLVGLDLMEGETRLGMVERLERFGDVDYFIIRTDGALVSAGKPKEFLVPYQGPYVLSVDLESQTIQTRGGMDLLDAS